LQAVRVRIDPREVIHETIDGEVILIALSTGCYYSLEGAGADVWDGLAAGRTTSAVAAGLERRHTAEPGAIVAAVGELVSRLVEERLVVPLGDDEAAPDEPREDRVDAPRSPFPAPVLRKFTDMQDFLLVDPIHDVDDAGWPHVPAAR
jgi:hypothetical protein